MKRASGTLFSSWCLRVRMRLSGVNTRRFSEAIWEFGEIFHMKFWLMKSEPEAFGIDDLANRPDQTEPWDGVRNYQARNMLRDEMKVGDEVGLVVKTALPELLAGRKKSQLSGHIHGHPCGVSRMG